MMDPTTWDGPYTSRDQLNGLVEEYVRNARNEFGDRVQREIEEHLRPRAWSHWPALEERYRRDLHAGLDRIWSKHLARTSGLS